MRVRVCACSGMVVLQLWDSGYIILLVETASDYVICVIRVSMMISIYFISCTAAISVNKSNIKEAFLTQPISEAFQNLFLDKIIEQS